MAFQNEVNKQKSAKLSISKTQKFSEWYSTFLEYAEIVDTRYPLKGCDVWRSYGFKALKLMMQIMEQLLENTGHEEAYFPMFVPISIFSKESDFLEGFTGEALHIAGTGNRQFEEQLVVRPTSETVMYYMFEKWIRSYRDLPLKIYQTVNIFRWETKMTRPLLRIREIIKFKEAHTAHSTAAGAEEQIREALQIYSTFFTRLGIAHLILRTPTWDTFAGAQYNYDLFTVLPDGKAIELGSVINLGQKFSRAFRISFRDEDGEEQFVWQTCYGVSERALGTALALHGDDHGLIFPPQIAPIQIIIVLIIGTQKRYQNEILTMAEQIVRQLAAYRVIIDNSTHTPGWKYHHWEAKGVPLRIEIGAHEIKENCVSIIRRDTRSRIQCDLSKLDQTVKDTFEIINQLLASKTKGWLQKNLYQVTEDLTTAIAQYEKRRGIIQIPWCGEDECGLSMTEQISGSALGYNESQELEGLQCLGCRKVARHFLHFGKTY